MLVFGGGRVGSGVVLEGEGVGRVYGEEGGEEGKGYLEAEDFGLDERERFAIDFDEAFALLECMSVIVALLKHH